MSDIRYNNRRWLNNPEESHYTGSIVCFDGFDLNNNGKTIERYSFVEISDCHGKSRIHRDLNLPISSYIEKLKLISDELNKYISYLEEE